MRSNEHEGLLVQGILSSLVGVGQQCSFDGSYLILALKWQAGDALHGDVARRRERRQQAAWLLCGGALK
jgi:hypothetical protein